jgi:predicted nuclease of predicted toxin-antitoxin system
VNIVADEGVDGAIVDRLRGDGYTVFYVAESASGLKDEQVLAAAYEREALLITADKDFGNLVFARRLPQSGVLLLRLAGLKAEQKAGLVSAVVVTHGDEMRSRFSVLTDKQLRIRQSVR